MNYFLYIAKVWHQMWPLGGFLLCSGIQIYYNGRNLFVWISPVKVHLEPDGPCFAGSGNVYDQNNWRIRLYILVNFSQSQGKNYIRWIRLLFRGIPESFSVRHISS